MSSLLDDFQKCAGNQLVTSTFCPTHFQNLLVMSSLLDDFQKCAGNQQLVTSTFCATHFQNLLVMSSLLDDFQNALYVSVQRSCVCFGSLYTPRPAILDTSLLPSVSRHICASLGSRSAAVCFLFLLQHECEIKSKNDTTMPNLPMPM